MRIVLYTSPAEWIPRTLQVSSWLENRGHQVIERGEGQAPLLRGISVGGRGFALPPGETNLIVAVGDQTALTGGLLLGAGASVPVVWWIPAGVVVTSRRRYLRCEGIWVEDPALAKNLPSTRGGPPEVVPLPQDLSLLQFPPRLLPHGQVISALEGEIPPSLPLALARGEGVLLISPEASPAARWLNLSEGGLVIPPDQETTLMVARLSLASDERLRQRLALKGRSWIQEEDLRQRCGPALDGALARLVARIGGKAGQP